MIGGFLGAGKTAAVAKLAAHLTAWQLRVSLITNDQGRNLVDTAWLRALGFPTEEIPGGCFCCRFNSLVEATQKLRIEQRPDVFIAEPVGSCTDLVATVAYPLRKFYAADFTVAPVSVLVDPFRAAQIFGRRKNGGFSKKVVYIYGKQLEEADLIVISKSDLLDSAALEKLRKTLAAQFPAKEILAVSSRTGAGLAGWFARLTGETQSATTAMKVNYAIYAQGEAMLGWLNCTVDLHAGKPFSADAFLPSLATQVQKRLNTQKAEIAHLKMTLKTPGSATALAVANMVRNDKPAETSRHLNKSVTNAQLTVNLRAEAAPDVLGAALREGLAAAAATFPKLSAKLDHLEHFRPGKPTPTHRLTKLAA
jgi:Ni2+-binding GTPase involved in maturation of urease and hydrogenase